MAKTVAAGEVQWTDILEDVKRHEEVVITQDGEPVARVVPVPSQETQPDLPMTVEEFRRRYPIKILGDIMEPLEDEWDVMK